MNPSYSPGGESPVITGRVDSGAAHSSGAAAAPAVSIEQSREQIDGFCKYVARLKVNPGEAIVDGEGGLSVVGEASKPEDGTYNLTLSFSTTTQVGQSAPPWQQLDIYWKAQEAIFDEDGKLKTRTVGGRVTMGADGQLEIAGIPEGLKLTLWPARPAYSDELSLLVSESIGRLDKFPVTLDENGLISLKVSHNGTPLGFISAMGKVTEGEVSVRVELELPPPTIERLLVRKFPDTGTFLMVVISDSSGEVEFIAPLETMSENPSFQKVEFNLPVAPEGNRKRRVRLRALER